MPATVAVLANPTAGRGRHEHLLAEVMTRLGGARLLQASTAEQALVEARSAVDDGVDALVAVGGDGTVHLGLQAVAGNDTRFGVVPTGTGNDFAVELDLPRGPLAAADAVAAALRDGRTRQVDLARLTALGPDPVPPRWFGAVLGAGFDSLVNERANAMRFPRGPRRYDLAILAELARLRPRRYTLHLDGVVHEIDAVLVAVGNTASYGGGMRICPAADPTDGLVDIVYATPIGRTTLIRIKPWVRQGTHVRHPAVHSMRAAVVELHGEGITTYADGERAFPLPVRVESVAGALRLLG